MDNTVNNMVNTVNNNNMVNTVNNNNMVSMANNSTDNMVNMLMPLVVMLQVHMLAVLQVSVDLLLLLQVQATQLPVPTITINTTIKTSSHPVLTSNKFSINKI